MDTTILDCVIDLNDEKSFVDVKPRNGKQCYWNAPSCQSILLTGPHKSGKTAILFDIAFNYAERDFSVLFISPHHIERLPMYIGDRKHPREGALKNIELVYPSTQRDLLHYMSSLHSCLGNKIFSLVIIDDISLFFKSGDKTQVASEIAKVCAYTVDAVTFLNDRSSSNGSRGHGNGCTLLASLTVLDEVSFFQQKQILERWFSNILKTNKVIHTLSEDEKKEQTFRLSNMKHIMDSGVPDISLLNNGIKCSLTYRIEENRIHILT